jgi:hypothetical protein
LFLLISNGILSEGISSFTYYFWAFGKRDKDGFDCAAPEADVAGRDDD